MSKKKEGSAGNIFWNILNPYIDSKQLGGNIIDVSTGTGVEWTVRYMLGRREGLWPLLFAHILGKPFEGLTAYFPTEKRMSEEEMFPALIGGVKQGLAVLIGKYIVFTAENGLVFRMPSFMDMLITVGSKGLDAGALAALYTSMPVTAQKQLEAARAQRRRYENASNLTTAKAK